MVSTALLPHCEIFPHIDDPARLAKLDATELLDSGDDEAFDRFTRLASAYLDCPVSTVTLVTKDRQFFKSAVGLSEPWASARQTPLTHSFCQHVVNSSRPLVISDAREVPLLQGNRAIEEMGVIAYLGVPLTSPCGKVLGSLCAIDTKPRAWSPESIQTLSDLAHLVATEIELRGAARSLRATHAQLLEAEAQRAELVQMLVHDLRNPLSSLISSLSVLDADGLTRKQADILDLAYHSGENLLGLIGDILEVNKADAGEMRLQCEPLDPGLLAETARAQLAFSAAAARVNLYVWADSALPLLWADAGKLRRVLVNLIANGMQHSRENGSVTTTVRPSETGDAVVFSVEDEGRGIPREAQARIFEKYFTVEARREGTPSCGLGLVFCKTVVDAHHGEINVQSEPGRGTKFRFTIPVRKPA